MSVFSALYGTMGIYYSDEVRLTGGSRQHECRVVVCDEPDQLLGLFRELKRVERWKVFLSTPPRGVESWRSKIRPSILIREECLGLVRDAGGVRIPSPYVDVIVAMLKLKFYEQKSGVEEVSPEVEHYFELKIRSKVIKLLESEEWIDDPEGIPDVKVALTFKKLNGLIEKIDLGRRNDLKYASFQDGRRPNYGPRPVRLYEGITNPGLREWIDGSTEKRITILQSKPWLRRQLEAEGVVIPKEILNSLL